jgi:tetratricopeptide (TPR) repeat protein
MWPAMPKRQILTLLALLSFVASNLLHSSRQEPERRRAVSSDPESLLAEANRLAWLDNWRAAGPFYDRAEALFRAAGDKRNEIFAHIGRIRAYGSAGSWERMSVALHQQLKNPIVKADRRLRLWCLALQGYVDVDLNIESAKRSWSEVLGIATGLGDQRWTARALGELGVIAFFQGNLTRAVRLVGDSVPKLAAAGDKAGVARLLTMAGYGLDPQRRFSEAKWFFIHAQGLMQSSPDDGFPFGAKIGYAEALAGEGDWDRARNLLYDALAEARFEGDFFHQADALIVLGEIASKTRELELAKHYFNQAATIANTLKLYRTSALAMSDLASVYRIQGKFAQADVAVQVALKADHHLGDRYYMPRDLAALAELKVAENQPRQAELLFEQAEDLTDWLMRYQHADYSN